MIVDTHTWRAVYSDGSALLEEEADGTRHGFAEVDQARLVAFELLPLDPRGRPYALRLAPGMRPIFFRDRRIQVQVDLASGAGTQQVRARYTVLGWQRTVHGVNVKALLYIDPDLERQAVILAGEDIDPEQPPTLLPGRTE